MAILSRTFTGATARWLPVVLGLWALVAASPSSLRAQEPTREYQIKALFLFNFVQFVEWPDHAFRTPDAPLRIGVLGEDPFFGALGATVQNERIRNRPLEVKHALRVQDLLDCQLIFVARSERAQTGNVIAVCAGKPILTVGDLPDFARRGGIVNFYLEGQKVRFEINRAAAQAAQLKLASQLASLARIVGPAVTGGNP